VNATEKVRILEAILPENLKQEFRAFWESPEKNVNILRGIFKAHGYEKDLDDFLKDINLNREGEMSDKKFAVVMYQFGAKAELGEFSSEKEAIKVARSPEKPAKTRLLPRSSALSLKKTVRILNMLDGRQEKYGCKV